MRLFISYASADRPFVESLVARLHSAGVQTWVDYRDIPPGANWDEAVEDALRDCDSMLLVLTPRSVVSGNVRDEWSYFLDERKPLYPILREDCEIPVRLRRPQRIDFTTDDAAALDRLLAALGVTVPSEQTTGDTPLQTAAAPAAELPRLPFEPETVLVPAGAFIFGEEHEKQEITLPEYRIGKYPVTVGEYRAFIEAGGYREQRYWTAAGWTLHEQGSWEGPFYWKDSKWTERPWFPVVGVSWYEAMAYCCWLKAATGRSYRLPSEVEWEKAARNADGRHYPWGNEWFTGICNAKEAGNDHITPVWQYSPAGDSPYCAADMAGNVWEWCRTPWRDRYEHREDEDAEGSAQRVVRGGAFNCDQNLVRSATRIFWLSEFQYHLIGFRVVCATP